MTTNENPTATSERRLVFGDDGSRGADIAWLWINNHPWPNWKLDVLTGADPLSQRAHWGSTPELLAWTPPWGRTFLGVEPPLVAYLHADADPRLLLDAQSDADLVVVGHSGRGHLRSHWMGSTAEWLLHHPEAPLLVVRSASNVERVTCCFDASVHAARAVGAFTACPFAVSTEVTVLTIDDGRTDTVAAAAMATAALERGGIEARVEVASGHPTNLIMDHIEERSPDLLVLGTKGLTGWRRLRLGSTAAAVVHHMTGNVLVACASEDSAGHRIAIEAAVDVDDGGEREAPHAVAEETSSR
jgi:nucleotide-binding universal stress UspA family protein